MQRMAAAGLNLCLLLTGLQLWTAVMYDSMKKIRVCNIMLAETTKFWDLVPWEIERIFLSSRLASAISQPMHTCYTQNVADLQLGWCAGRLHFCVMAHFYGPDLLQEMRLLVLAPAMLNEPLNQLAWIKFGWVLLLGLAFLVWWGLEKSAWLSSCHYHPVSVREGRWLPKEQSILETWKSLNFLPRQR